MSEALRDLFLQRRRPLVVTGTHGKTTTSAMCAWLLTRAELQPGWFIGGVPKNLPSAAAIGSTKRRIAATLKNSDATSGGPSPFVIEGDEYDSVFWIKRAKFFDYLGIGPDDVAILTSIEHDHIDIYPDAPSYEAAFREMVRMVPAGGLLVCAANDHRVRRVVLKEARARLAWYALEGDDTGEVTPTWLAAPAGFDPGGAQQFDLFAGGMSCGRFAMQVPGAHNVRNALAAVAACAEGFAVPIATAKSALALFQGVRRRQDLLGTPRGIRLYDDFAHHPTAVEETLRALRARHPEGALWAVFEARSATACRNIHQDEYARAFGPADQVIFAPLGRANLEEKERLDLPQLASKIGRKARVATSLDDIVSMLTIGVEPGDTIALLSNGAFGGIHARLLDVLGERHTSFPESSNEP
jgi:UDP-N-acetylmuramate: L-alanyl-gamma-D-glutamyl-meso-diaminopimelate ligase